MNLWLILLLGNIAYLAIYVPLELWRHTRQERLATLRKAGPKCAEAGWIPIAFRWKGRLHTRPEFEMRHTDGRRGFARVER